MSPFKKTPRYWDEVREREQFKAKLIDQTMETIKIIQKSLQAAQSICTSPCVSKDFTS